MANATTKERAHELIERMPPEKVPAAVEALTKVFDPVAYSLANAPFEDEEISEDENRVAAEARARGYVGSQNSHEELLKELGLTLEDWDRMADQPITVEVRASKRA